MKTILLLWLVLGLAACGGPGRFAGGAGGARPMASGPISDACLASGRKARSVALCGCIQAVANDTLNGFEQRRAVAFYRDLQSAQDIRQSQRAGDQRFWTAYTAYAERADRVCK
ncbi:hypothetical protein [Roseovarius nitratireducens]|uniref:hypothetical protein n=1 Tax=Roseovarius nitratireducens TaxID=2044597 RepID=UPI000CE1C03F|nr:hypothetical protein [Roseovarius nitratireducens]